ncbi:MAG: hypothetical protein Q9227_002489 [Pyrenula ochraceoflavens]
MSSQPEPAAGLQKSKSEPAILDDEAPELNKRLSTTSSTENSSTDGLAPLLPSPSLSPHLSRNTSFTSSHSLPEDDESFPPLDRLSVFDLLDNLALPQRIEKWQNSFAAQAEKVRRQREKIGNRFGGLSGKDRAVAEWRKRVPTADEQLDKYKRRMRDSVDNLQKRWADTATVTAREKMSFIAGVLNVFISGYLIGAAPAHFYWWFTAQLCYFMPLRFFTYHRKGYHYFLADLCYFVNFLAVLSIWVAPQSKRLFISTYCLAYGNNAIAIAMWRNSMVFHSLDKVISLFIHIMPPVTLHTIVHLTPDATLQERFPAVYSIKYSNLDAPQHYHLPSMVLWTSLAYLVWQLSYHFFITVRRGAKIAAGRPTSFTWLRRSYSQTWIGKLVLSLPNSLQNTAFMLIQYSYAFLTMLPCPIWFWYRWPSALFLLLVFSWSVYNGATFYIDVFGTRFQKELEQVKKDVAKWQAGSEGGMVSAMGSPETKGKEKDGVEHLPALDSNAALPPEGVKSEPNLVKKGSNTTGRDHEGENGVPRERRPAEAKESE